MGILSQFLTPHSVLNPVLRKSIKQFKVFSQTYSRNPIFLEAYSTGDGWEGTEAHCSHHKSENDVRGCVILNQEGMATCEFIKLTH
jgi:hypothetical protein